MEESRLTTILNLERVFYFLVPVVSNKETFLNLLIKFTSILNNNVKIVSIDAEENKEHIGYNQLVDYNERLSNTFFVIFDYDILIHYAANVLTQKSDNRFLILLDINETSFGLKNYALISKIRTLFFYAKNQDFPINFTSSTKESYIFGDHLKAYLNDYLKTQNLVSLDKKENTNSAKILNVYFDEKIKSLENIGIDKALKRAPKFKTILLDILTKNKKRHLIKMIDGRHGIDSFITVYNKLKNSPPLVIIKKADSYDTKIKKLQIFNESNAPGILLTDYNFSQKMVPKNVDYYHVTDGGDNNDFITFFDCCKARNYSGPYPRDIELVSHIVVTTGDNITIDMERNKNFMLEYNKILDNFDKIIKGSRPLYLKGNEYYASTK